MKNKMIKIYSNRPLLLTLNNVSIISESFVPLYILKNLFF